MLDASSMLRKKSAGMGRLNIQRREYSWNAKSNNSRPRMVSRKIFNAVAGFEYPLGPNCRIDSELVMIGTWDPLLM